MRRAKPAEPEGAPDWMVTFADLMTLLMCFFVMLFSMSQLEVVKFGGLAASLRQALYGTPDSRSVPDRPHANDQRGGALLPHVGKAGDRRPLPEVGEDKGTPGDGGMAQPGGDAESTRALVADAGLDEFAGLVEVVEDNLYVMVKVSGVVSFGRGEVAVTAPEGSEVRRLFDRLASILRRAPQQVMVVGHSDASTSRSSRFPSNWELSSARAAAVVRNLVAEYDLDESLFLVAGHGHTAPVTVGAIRGAAARNRRVEFWLRKRSVGI